MELFKDLMKGRARRMDIQQDVEIKDRFRNLLREALEVAAQNGHTMRLVNIQSEATHMWANLMCTCCGNALYLNSDKEWSQDKIFGMAALVDCEQREE